ncbi:Uncharacterized protein TCAP_06278 [Tolypocladium capitatum]|uniref:ERT1/acuK family PAS domain-containing protein n=1 Tax=Tolypocladium capitatum TaxID=45235 RepID=A0A2K3Q8B7_9HYPO|nr:Uncharacterized protein TCAP_06278 [Tolypocladium capitatum]
MGPRTNNLAVAGFSDAWLTAQTFNDMNSYNPNYMIAPHVTHEFNLLNDFLHSGLLDDGGLAPDETRQNAAFNRTGQSDMLPGNFGGRTALPAGGSGSGSNLQGGSMPPPPSVDGKGVPRTANSASDKTREYYLQAADPSGNDNAEQRMTRVLKAKYEAGLLRPFNYINGYARLSKYLDGHIAASSKQKILRTINQFRPKFREKAQGLTDMQLVYVEMWFEMQLMDYDRVFASMAVPACCWRRTGEIFRGNKEMAELINVPVDRLRDGKIALHEILTEESMVRYWEEFGTIAFDPAHETLLTACALKNPSDTSDHPIVKCCFSFTIRRDDHKLPCLSHLPQSPLHWRPSPPDLDLVHRQTAVTQLLCNQLCGRSAMPPADPALAGRDRKIRSIVDFAVDLESTLPLTRDAGAVDVLLADLGHHIQTMTNLPQQSAAGISTKAAKELERQGRNLWNLCIRVSRDAGGGSPSRERTRLLVRARFFAFQILELGRQAGGHKRDAEAEAVYLLNLALTLGRICIGDAEPDSARLALQKAAQFVERLKAVAEEDSLPDPSGARRRLETEYLTMRMALSWKEDRLDVAEHMFSKTGSLRQNLHVSSAENMADTLQHIGADLSSAGDHNMALKWFKRASDLINSQNLEQLSVHGLELRLAICQGRVQSLLAIGSPGCLQEAVDLVAYVESEIGDKPVVLHWRLEILQKSPDEVFDAEAYASILRRMIRCFDFSHGTFHFLLHHIKELRDKSSRLACGLLDELLKQHVLHSGNVAWINKAVVRRIWMATMDSESAEPLTVLHGLLDQVYDALSEPLSPDATGAAHSLIWKTLEAMFTKPRISTADAWCTLALHQVFSNCGEANLGKFGRKRILCALGLNDADRARSAFQNMPEGAQDDILTRYLMFKVSLLCWDHELGSKCIKHLSGSTDNIRRRDILYACVREAQQVGDKLCTLAALKAVAGSWTAGKTSPSNVPSILRCTIRLIHMVEEDEGAAEHHVQRSDFAEDICEIFGKAAEHSKQDPRDDQGNKVFTIPELHWFRKNAYNIGATKCHTWELPCIVRIFNFCLGFIDCYPEDLPLTDVAELTLMGMRCHFVIAAALVSLARAEDRIDEQLQRYLETRHHVAAFDGLIQTEVGPQEEEIMRDVVRKMATLFVFDFESAVCLKNWDDLNQIVRKAKLCKDEVMYKAMGDCLLRSHAPGKVVYATMRLIIDEIFELENFDNEKLARYIRCMVQAIMPLDDTLALQLVDQALQIAREGHRVRRPFPSAELEWLVATTFNHAVDFYARGEEDPCHRWALKAMDLAEYVGDGGGLAAMLQDKFAKLRFEKGTGRRFA